MHPDHHLLSTVSPIPSAVFRNIKLFSLPLWVLGFIGLHTHRQSGILGVFSYVLQKPYQIIKFIFKPFFPSYFILLPIVLQLAQFGFLQPLGVVLLLTSFAFLSLLFSPRLFDKDHFCLSRDKSFASLRVKSLCFSGYFKKLLVCIFC